MSLLWMPGDPIDVDYSKPIGNDPTVKDHPELLKMKSSPGHNDDKMVLKN